MKKYLVAIALALITTEAMAGGHTIQRSVQRSSVNYVAPQAIVVSPLQVQQVQQYVIPQAVIAAPVQAYNVQAVQAINSYAIVGGCNQSIKQSVRGGGRSSSRSVQRFRSR